MKTTPALVGLVCLTTGCATLLANKHKDFAFDTAPAGAQVIVDGTPVGTTPATVSLSNTRAHTVLFKKQGYADVGCQLQKSTNAGWVILDVLFGLEAVVIDAVTGDWSHTSNNRCVQTLQPVEVVATTAAASPGSPAMDERGYAPPVSQIGGAPIPATLPEPGIASTRRAKPDAVVDASVSASHRDVVIAPAQHNGPAPAARPESPVASEAIGAPLSESAAVAGRSAFDEGRLYLDRHEWNKAEYSLREALRYDGSKALYHAELGRLLMAEQQWAEAEAAYTAAVVLDVDNIVYRARLKEVRLLRDGP